MNPLITKLKLQLKLAINRLRLVQQKDTALAKQNRRLMAQLLESGREASAKIRVENIIQSDIFIELLEILELYCELLLARISLLEPQFSSSSSSSSAAAGTAGTAGAGNNSPIDPGLVEAIKTIIIAAPRTGIKELVLVRELLIIRYGREFAANITLDDSDIPAKVRTKLEVKQPSEQLVTLYLMEIARAYNVDYSPEGYSETVAVVDDNNNNDNDKNDNDNNNGGGGGYGLVPVTPLRVATPPAPTLTRRLSGMADLPVLGDSTDMEKPPISLVSPEPRSDNPRPKVLIPRDLIQKTVVMKKTKEDEELDELKLRFERLKKR